VVTAAQSRWRARKAGEAVPYKVRSAPAGFPQRPCLCCRKPFWPQARFNRVCEDCKSSAEWRRHVPAKRVVAFRSL